MKTILTTWTSQRCPRCWSAVGIGWVRGVSEIISCPGCGARLGFRRSDVAHIRILQLAGFLAVMGCVPLSARQWVWVGLYFLGAAMLGAALPRFLELRVERSRLASGARENSAPGRTSKRTEDEMQPPMRAEPRE